jgi:tripartite-type tricarboxylate transporter receptor subunit TctC
LRILTYLAFIGVASGTAPGTAPMAHAYPDKPVRVIVPQAAGSSFDSVVRLVSVRLAERWKQPVVVDNRPGANGIIGLEAGAKANADGYTVITGAISHLSVNPSVYKNLPYRPLEDFDAVTQLVSITFLVVAHPAFAGNSVKNLVALAKAKPQAVRYASSGSGNMNHLGAELFASVIGAKMLHLPYKGETPAMTGLLGGESDMMFTTMPIAVPHIETGRLRALAVASAARTPRLPDLPTLAEAGVPGVEITGWAAVMAPRGTPKPIINTLHSDIAALLQMPDVKQRLMATGADPVGSTPEQFRAFLTAETRKWAKVISDAGLALNQ